jgi:ubiquinone/menaquinone biosynthesis C-methylase UbiE
MEAKPLRDWFRFTEVSAQDYERLRPEYAPEAGEWLAERAGLGSDSVVLDLGAGTGKLTRLLIGRAGAVVALEPAANMLAVLREVVPEAVALEGTAEAIPLPDGSIDLAMAGHSFHHFSWPAALAEMHRTVRPVGSLALVWSLSDPADPLEPAIGAIVRRHLPSSPIHVAFDSWREAFTDRSLFEEVQTRTFPHQQRIRSEALVDLMATSSDVASMQEDERQALLMEIGALGRNLSDPIVVARQTRVHLFRRLDRGDD